MVVTYFEDIDHVQLDDSFKAAWPYVYSVPQGIQANEALPLGMDINVSVVSRPSSLSNPSWMEPT
jgi:hypothetical protein